MVEADPTTDPGVVPMSSFGVPTLNPKRWGWAESARHLTMPVTVLVVGGLVIALVHSLSHDLDYRAMVRALRQLPVTAIGLSIGATIASFVALIGREYCGMRYIGVRVPPSILAIASFCGNALGNAIGLGPLSGGAIRYRMYRSVGLSPEAVGGIIAFTTLGSAIDVVLFAALSAIVAAPAIGALYHVSPIAIDAVAAPLLVATTLLVGFCSIRRKAVRIRGHVLAFPGPRLFLAQLVFTGLDVMAAAASLWVLLPDDRIALLPFVAIFTVATGLGIISSVPGGLGIFDALVVAGLSSQVPANQVAAAVLAYRGIYFLLPLIVTAALLAGFELRGAAGRANSAVARAASRAAPTLTPHVVGALVFVMGVVLMISGATPSFGSRLASLQSALPLWAVESANFLASIDRHHSAVRRAGPVPPARRCLVGRLHPRADELRLRPGEGARLRRGRHYSRRRADPACREAGLQAPRLLAERADNAGLVGGNGHRGRRGAVDPVLRLPRYAVQP